MAKDDSMIHLKYLKFNESYHAMATSAEIHRTNVPIGRANHLIDRELN